MAKQGWQLRQPVTAAAAEFQDLKVVARETRVFRRAQGGFECLTTKAIKVIRLGGAGTATNRTDAPARVHLLIVNIRVRVFPETRWSVAAHFTVEWLEGKRVVGLE